MFESTLLPYCCHVQGWSLKNVALPQDVSRSLLIPSFVYAVQQSHDNNPALVYTVKR
jgi:hypothetical protein